MKQLKLIVCIIAALLLGSTAVHAQKGTQALGASAYLGRGADHWDEAMNYGIDLSYQYSVSNYYRIRPHLAIGSNNYEHNDDYLDYNHVASVNYLIGLDNNIFFTSGKRLRPYINLGIGIGNFGVEKDSYSYEYYNTTWEKYYYSWDYYEETTTSLALSGGIGIDYRINRNLYLQAELDFKYFTRGEYNNKIPMLSIGVGYIIN